MSTAGDKEVIKEIKEDGDEVHSELGPQQTMCDDEKEVKIEMKQEPADPLTITSDSFNHSENGDLPVLPLLKSEPDAAAGECKAVVNGLDPLGQQPGILQLADRLEEVASTAQVGISRTELPGSSESQELFCSECSKSFSSMHKYKLHQLYHVRKKYNCPECGIVSASAANLKVHMRVHTGERPFSCSACSQTFSRANYLKNHLLRHTGEKPYRHKCSACCKSFALSKDLQNHCVTDHPVTSPVQGNKARVAKSGVVKKPRKRVKEERKISYQCKKCDQSFPYSSQLKEHLRDHVGEDPFSCSECSVSFPEVRLLKEHMKSVSHTKDNLYECSLCKKSFPAAKLLRSHFATHSAEKAFSCNKCPRAYNVERLLIAHQRMHSGEKPLNCSQCSQRFAFPSNLRVHINKYHSSDANGSNYSGREQPPGKDKHLEVCENISADKIKFSFPWSESESSFLNGEKPHICPICPKSFVHYSDMKQHVDAHGDGKKMEKNKAHICAYCNKTFSSSQKLIVHLRIHTGEKPFSCSVCAKTFPYFTSLKYHMVTIHSEDRPFECHECPRKFKLSGDLKIHMRIHTGVRPYSCSDCCKTFKRSLELNSHRRVHTGEKPYLCPDCGRPFAHSKDLKGHMLLHTGEKPYRCSECDLSFVRLFQLKNHKRKSHVL